MRFVRCCFQGMGLAVLLGLLVSLSASAQQGDDHPHARPEQDPKSAARYLGAEHPAWSSEQKQWELRVRDATVLVRCNPHSGTLITLRVFKSYALKTSWLCAEVQLQSNSVSQHLRRLAESESDLRLVDVGANVGIWTLLLASLFPSGQILSIEPSPSSYRYLLWNVREAGLCDRVRVLNGGVSAAAGTALIVEAMETIGPESHVAFEAARLVPEGTAAGTADQFTSSVSTFPWSEVVDLVMAGSTVSRPSVLTGAEEQLSRKLDVVKLDCEGCEWEIFLTEAWRNDLPGYAFGELHFLELQAAVPRVKNFRTAADIQTVVATELCDGIADAYSRLNAAVAEMEAANFSDKITAQHLSLYRDEKTWISSNLNQSCGARQRKAKSSPHTLPQEVTQLDLPPNHLLDPRSPLRKAASDAAVNLKRLNLDMGRLWAAGYAAIGWRNRIQTPPLFHPLVKRLDHGFVNLDLAGVREYVDVFRKARDELADAFQELHLEKTMARRIGWGNLWLWDSFDSTFDDRCRQHPNSPLCRHFLPILPRDKPAFDFEEYLFAVYSMEPNTNLSMHNDGSNARVSLHLCIHHCDGAWLKVGDQIHEFSDQNPMVAFDISWDHSAGYRGSKLDPDLGTKDRLAAVLTIPHPELIRGTSTL